MSANIWFLIGAIVAVLILICNVVVWFNYQLPIGGW